MGYKDYTGSQKENIMRNRTISNVPNLRNNEDIEDYGTFPDGTNYLFMIHSNPILEEKYYQFVVDFTENYGMYLRAYDIINFSNMNSIYWQRFFDILNNSKCAFPFGNKIEFYCNEECFPLWRNYYHISNFVLLVNLSEWDSEEQLFMNKITGKITPDVFEENPGKREIFLNSVFSQIRKIRPFLKKIISTQEIADTRDKVREIKKILKKGI